MQISFMVYDYKFDKEDCWYKNVCRKYNTEFCTAGCIRYMEVHFLMYTSNIPKNMQKAVKLSPEKVDIKAFITLKNIKDNIIEFVKGGNSVYIYSENFGNGKTTWAIKLMQQFFDEVWAGNGFKPRGVFIHVPTFLTKIKDGISKKDDYFEMIKELLPEVDLVIWDDIASTALSNYDYSNLLTYIDQRKLNGLSNIYTGNIAQKDLQEAVGNRLASRVWNDSLIVEFVGMDRRGD